MSSNHLILCHPLLLPPSIFPSIRVFSKESVLCIRWPKYWSFSFSISPSKEYSGLKNIWQRSWPAKSIVYALWPFFKKKTFFADPAPGRCLLELSCCCHLSTGARPLVASLPRLCSCPARLTCVQFLLGSPPGLGVLRTCDQRKGQETRVRTTFKRQAKKRLKGTER